MSKPILCSECKHMKSKMVGYVSSVHWCGAVGNGHKHTSIGVEPWRQKPHPKCPLKESK